MTFEEIMTFWKMKNMVHNDSCMLREKMLDSDDMNVLYMAEVRDTPRNGEKHANVVYRYTLNKGVKSDFELVYADLLYTGFAGWSGSDQIYVRNATVGNLIGELNGKWPYSSGS